MAVSVFDLFKIGIGPSSSHTVGPMRAAGLFVEKLRVAGQLNAVASIRSELFGSLGATGKGHGSDTAVMLGLLGENAERVDPQTVPERIAALRQSHRLQLPGGPEIRFDPQRDLVLHKRRSLPRHSNGMQFMAADADGAVLAQATYFSVGGGFVIDDSDASIVEDCTEQPFAFDSAADLLALCEARGCAISDLMLQNESVWRTESAVRDGLMEIWRVMQACVERGCQTEGVLPGGMQVRRRAPALYRKLCSRPELGLQDPLTVMDWVNLYALAVNEENAAGGRVVTAPTNGAAGIVPAVLHYFVRFNARASDEGVVRFLLTAGAIGLLYKKNASISGAEVGCQGEVGSACSMAAGALAEVLGGSPGQVENAAEIAMEHNLGLTCDPVGGLVQVPCIERNAMASVKAINAARLALRGDGQHCVSLDKVIRTMRETGADMKTKYKETARGGLALHVLEVPVNIVEC